jgi:iron complex transport system substrate-binding protein
VVPGGAADGTTWRDDLRYVAAALDKQAEAEELTAEHDERVEELQGELASVAQGKTVASPQVTFDRAQIRVDADSTFSSVLLEELGLTLAPSVAAADKPVELSFERLPELDADILFWHAEQVHEDVEQALRG